MATAWNQVIEKVVGIICGHKCCTRGADKRSWSGYDF